MKVNKSLIPSLRFPIFDKEWEETRIENLLLRVAQPVELKPENDYREIGIRSHGRGIFHKPAVKGKSLGTKRVFYVESPAFILNIVFAWEHAIALTGEGERGFIASHRFPMFVPKKGKADLDFVRFFFLRDWGKHLLGLASPGGAGRNRTLGQKEFLNLKVIFPGLEEQTKIAKFLRLVDTKLKKLTIKRRLLQKYKRGLVQQFLSQTIRFKDKQNKNFPAWELKKLGDVIKVTKEKSNGDESVFSVSVHKGLVDQIEHLGRRYSAANTTHYNRVNPGDLVYTKSPTGDFPMGIIKQSQCRESVIVSPLYGVFKPEDSHLGYWLEVYFESSTNTNNYLRPIVQKGAKNTINISNSNFLSSFLKLPVSSQEVEKISLFFLKLNRKIELVDQEIEQLKLFKSGLLQRMFV